LRLQFFAFLRKELAPIAECRFRFASCASSWATPLFSLLVWTSVQSDRPSPASRASSMMNFRRDRCTPCVVRAFTTALQSLSRTARGGHHSFASRSPSAHARASTSSASCPLWMNFYAVNRTVTLLSLITTPPPPSPVVEVYISPLEECECCRVGGWLAGTSERQDSSNAASSSRGGSQLSAGGSWIVNF
jgi:hypothetical protein